VLAHDTPLKKIEVEPLGFGLVTIDQLVPSQCSANVWVAPGIVYLPTA
jgi:hypothetical protein